MKYRYLLLGLLGCVSALQAQRITRPAFSAPPVSPLEITGTYAATGSGDVEVAGANTGSLKLQAWRTGISYRQPLSERFILQLGASYGRVHLDSSGYVPLPETLESLNFDLAGTWVLNREWSLTAMLRPGFSGDTHVSTSDAFNIPATVLARWQATEKLSVIFGARYDENSEYELFPVAGVVWQFAPQWRLSVGIPRTEVSYALNESTQFFGGLTGDFGTYAVKNANISAPPGYPSLRDTWLEYRDLRFGVGARQKLTSTLTLQVDVGTTLDRKFDYMDRDFEVKTDNAVYGAVSLVAKF